MEHILHDDRKKVVNTEEQNEPINPGDRLDDETVSSINPSADNNALRKTDEGSEQQKEAEKPKPIEGDDTPGIDKTVPKL